MAPISDVWPTGGVDPLLDELQQQYLPDLGHVDIAGLMQDPRLGDIAVVSSFGADSIVLLHVMSQMRPGLPVLFLETGKHFPETLDYVARVESLLGLNLVRVRPDDRILAEDDPAGELWRDHADGCCRIRKVLPLQDALAPYDCWVSGRKRFQSGTRAAVPVLERDGDKIKLNPLALWGADDVRDHIRKHDLPLHPLVARGFPSIGCAPCTRPVSEGEDPRAGRWAHAPEKTECGIHLGPDGKFRRG